MELQAGACVARGRNCEEPRAQGCRLVPSQSQASDKGAAGTSRKRSSLCKSPAMEETRTRSGQLCLVVERALWRGGVREVMGLL